jgi:ABC-type lipoprotein export system ATPase subunit
MIGVMYGFDSKATGATSVADEAINSQVMLFDGSQKALPISPAAPLFIVGPNGTGKSGLILALGRANKSRSVRIAAHRQNWMESNAVTLSPADRANTEQNIQGIDIRADARWSIWNPSQRNGLIIAGLIDADNELSRKIRVAVREDNTDEAKRLAVDLPPLEIISDLLAASGIPIVLSIGLNSTILASKKGGPEYSVAALSDGERAALLIAGMVLTAKSGSLILIDEPERHLHSSIVTPLLLQLLSKRLDCAFVVSTHELSLAVSSPSARTVLVRDSLVVGEDIAKWDLDVLEPGVDVDDLTKQAILGSRRKMLFIEGDASSLDKPLYELLFPGVTIFPRSTCSAVEYAVTSVRDTASITWMQAYGIVDKDQLTAEKIAALEIKGVFPLRVYSVEALYYNPTIVKAVAQRQSSIIGGDPSQMVSDADAALVAAISANVDRLAARMSEQVVKDQISLGMPDWKKIMAGQNVSIAVDAQAHYQVERQQLNDWLAANEVANIIARYPIRETQALAGIVAALQFKSRAQYEAAARKVVMDESEMRAFLMAKFGGLSAAIG